MLTITLLGTAATMPLPERALTAAVAECGGHSLLLDCGDVSKSNGSSSFGYLSKIRSIFIRLFSLIVSFTPLIYFISFVFGIIQSLVRPGCLET